jgi:uncharacterized protein (TIGR02147 family)
MKSAFHYTDYRLYLRDLIAARRAAGGNAWSYRAMGGRMGVSHSALHHVVAGRMALTPNLLSKIARVFEIPETEVRFLRSLACFTHARTQEEKRTCLQDIYRLVQPERMLPESLRAEVCSQWHHTAIWALLTCRGYPGDFAALGAMLVPAISARDAARSVGLLLDLGVLVRDAGGYRVVVPVFAAGEGPSVALAPSVLEEALGAARTAMGQAPSRCMIKVVTLPFSPEAIDQANDEVRLCVTKLVAISRACYSADRVHHFGICSFPASVWPIDMVVKQQTADSRQQTADSRQQTADSRQQTADSRQQTADSRQQTFLSPRGLSP